MSGQPSPSIQNSPSEYTQNIFDCFVALPEIAKPLVGSATTVFRKIREMLYRAPAFINAVKASIPQEAYQLFFTDEQKTRLADGTLELMTRKDGTLMTNLIHPKTKRVVSTASLRKVNLSPELTQALTSYAAQMQLAQIAQDIQAIQIAIEGVRQGLENDRLAAAYSCQQRLLQAMAVQNPRLKEAFLLQIAADAENSRNRLMLSQSTTASTLKNRPESSWKKLISHQTSSETDAQIAELRTNLYAVNLASLVEALAYQELGETQAAKLSLQYYANHLQTVFPKAFVDRLSVMDPSPENDWHSLLANIQVHISKLSATIPPPLLEEANHGTETM